jgi:hypothetical protein
MRPIDKDVTDILSAMVPTSLDNIIRANRDKFDLALANDEQLAHLSKPVDVNSLIKREFTDWRFIALTADVPERGFWMERVFLVGRQSHHKFVTSPVVAIDRGHHLVRTQNSVYRLAGDPGIGEPDESMLIMVCATFNSWGWGPLLGVPAFFF